MVSEVRRWTVVRFCLFEVLRRRNFLQDVSFQEAASRNHGALEISRRTAEPLTLVLEVVGDLDGAKKLVGVVGGDEAVVPFCADSEDLPVGFGGTGNVERYDPNLRVEPEPAHESVKHDDEESFKSKQMLGQPKISFPFFVKCSWKMNKWVSLKGKCKLEYAFPSKRFVRNRC